MIILHVADVHLDSKLNRHLDDRRAKERRDELKDHGGFVGGWLKGGIRKRGHVISRCVGCLDADNIPEGVAFPALCRKEFAGITWFLYSTHKHRPEAPRYRLVFLFDQIGRAHV